MAMVNDMEPDRQNEDGHDAGEATPAPAGGLRKKPIMPPQLEQVMNDIAPDEGKEIITGAVAKIERRIHVLEKALAKLTEKHEQSVKDRVRALATAEESITALIARFDAKERDGENEFAQMRSSIRLLEECIVREKEAVPAPPADAANDTIGETANVAGGDDQTPSLFGNTESVLPEKPFIPTGAEPVGPPGKPDNRDDYLTSARRAALAVAVDVAPSKEAARRKDTRMKILAVAILAPVAILGAALVLVSRNASTASPIAAVESAADRAQGVPAAAIPEAPAERQAEASSAAPAPKRSLAVLKAAADAGDVTAIRDVGLKYLLGDEVDASDIEAVRWLIRAAYRNEAEAQYWLATLYAQGRGVPKDAFQAIHWYEAAAKQGYVRAMHNLAVAHYEGWDREKNLPEAVKWFQEASEHGNTDSAFNLAVLYELGTGVPQDTVKAFTWYSIAAAAGDAEAAKRIEFLVPRLTPDDIRAATEAVAAFKSRG